MKHRVHKITGVAPDSLAWELGIEPGDELLKINGHYINDIFDYHYYMEDTYVEVLIRKPDGEEWLLEVEKDEDEELDVTFENGLMDDYRSCANKCMFCFIDQLPEGMRDTLYFKDDDSRLSFIQGNYVTLTNMSDKDIDRIIEYRLSPINISIHTMDPQLRCTMLHNRNAGKALKKLERLGEAGVEMNGQIVLCRGVNDRDELDSTIKSLERYIPSMRSVSVVPVGLTRFREGLYPLEPLRKEDYEDTIDRIEAWQSYFYEKYGCHFVHASDEFYLCAGRPIPEAERYDGYVQLENGVGMMRLLQDEVEECLLPAQIYPNVKRELSIATGYSAVGLIEQLTARINEHYPNIRVHIYAIRNDFFGENITVSGLITGTDLIKQLKGVQLGERLLLPINMLRSGENVFLDDITVPQLEKALDIKTEIVGSGGADLVRAITGADLDGESFVFRPYEIKENNNE